MRHRWEVRQAKDCHSLSKAEFHKPFASPELVLFCCCFFAFLGFPLFSTNQACFSGVLFPAKFTGLQKLAVGCYRLHKSEDRVLPVQGLEKRRYPSSWSPVQTGSGCNCQRVGAGKRSARALWIYYPPAPCPHPPAPIAGACTGLTQTNVVYYQMASGSSGTN